MYGPKVTPFHSFQDFLDYCERNPAARNSVSPGGAASTLGCSRPFVYSLAQRGHLRAWTIYDRVAGPAGSQGDFGKGPPVEQASFVFVSLDDVERYRDAPKNKGGRPRKAKADPGAVAA